MKKIFISQPMVGKTSDEIYYERETIIETMKMLAMNVDVIDSLVKHPEDTKNPSLWCLGKSIELLAEADLAVFAKGWQQSRGCWMEHEACIRYGIEILYW